MPGCVAWSQMPDEHSMLEAQLAPVRFLQYPSVLVGQVARGCAVHVVATMFRHVPLL